MTSRQVAPENLVPGQSYMIGEPRESNGVVRWRGPVLYRGPKHDARFYEFANGGYDRELVESGHYLFKEVSDSAPPPGRTPFFGLGIRNGLERRGYSGLASLGNSVVHGVRSVLGTRRKRNRKSHRNRSRKHYRRV
jgi:hypothetical protein